MKKLGTTTPGAATEEQTARWVRSMFSEVAPKYDLLNHILSLNIDRGWRRALLASLDSSIKRQSARVLDLCCGTGDVLIDLQTASAAKATVFGADFCHPMLVAAGRKSRKKGRVAHLFEADALALPLRSNTFDAISISFGFRNLTNYGAGLEELCRILKPDGVLAILEFSHPQGFFMRSGYAVYSKFILPAVGQLISGSRDAYAYLPESIRNFPAAEVLKTMMEGAGFEGTRFDLLTGGIAALHFGVKRRH